MAQIQQVDRGCFAPGTLRRVERCVRERLHSIAGSAGISPEGWQLYLHSTEEID